MSSYLADRVLAAENVEVLHHTEIRRMHGGGRTETVEIEKDRTGETSTAPAAVFMFIGAAPRTAWLLPEVATDAKGRPDRPGRGKGRPRDVDLERLTEYAVEVRYPADMPDITMDEATLAVEDAAQLVSAVQSDLGPRVNEEAS